jgi:hypothetical protein
MRRKGSRYENTKAFSKDKNFAGFRERTITSPAGILEYTLQNTDRTDLLSEAYYKNDRRWWRILDANSSFLYGFELLEEDNNGEMITIPSARENQP